MLNVKMMHVAVSEDVSEFLEDALAGIHCEMKGRYWPEVTLKLRKVRSNLDRNL